MQLNVEDQQQHKNGRPQRSGECCMGSGIHIGWLHQCPVMLHSARKISLHQMDVADKLIMFYLLRVCSGCTAQQ